MQEWRTAVTRSIARLGDPRRRARHPHRAEPLEDRPPRSTWRLPLWEAMQIVLGLTIPLLLFVHLAQMRGHHIMLDQATRYSETLPDLWNKLCAAADGAAPGRLGARLHRPAFLAAAQPGSTGASRRRCSRSRSSIPTLALAGFVVAGRDAAAKAAASAAPRRPSSGYGDLWSDTPRDDYVLRRAAGRAADLRPGAGRPAPGTPPGR